MVGYTEIGHKRGSRRSVVMSANRTSSEAGRFPWLPCRSAPDRVCRAAFDHSRCVMDTCGLERVERFRINLNEKNFASQKNSLTSSLPQRCRGVGRMAAATIRLSMYPTSVLLRKEHRIRVALARTDASLLSGTGRRITQVDGIREAQRASYLDLPMKTHVP